MRSAWLVASLIGLVGGEGVPGMSPARAPAPLAANEIVDTAIARMGRPAMLQGLSRVRLQQVVQWLTLRLDDQPHVDAPSYNVISELRDYRLNSSRSSRRITNGNTPTGWSDWLVVVQDTVAMARVDEKMETAARHLCRRATGIVRDRPRTNTAGLARCSRSSPGDGHDNSGPALFPCDRHRSAIVEDPRDAGGARL
jgi:hypothetical protein